MAAGDVQFEERVNSRTATGNSLSLKYLAWGSTSTFDVREAIALTFPMSNGANPTLWLNLPGVQIEQVGDLLDHWDCTIPYIFPTNKSERERREERKDYSWTWELRGRIETAHITRAFKSKRQKKADAGLADSPNTLIGYDRATGEIRGADVPVHARELVVSFYLPIALFTPEFVDQVEEAHDKLNTETFLGRAAGKVLFVDSNFGSDNANYQNVKVDYTFWIGRQYSVHLEGFAQPIIVPPHWIFDARTETKDDPDPDIGERAFPTEAYIHCPFEETDLSFLMPTDPEASGSSGE